MRWMDGAGGMAAGATAIEGPTTAWTPGRKARRKQRLGSSADTAIASPEPASQAMRLPREVGQESERFPIDPDLRRRLGRRDAAEVIVERAKHLLPADAALVRAVYADGVPVSRLAALSDAQAGAAAARALRRRLRRLLARMLSERFVGVLRRQEEWGVTRRRVAAACVLQGLTMRQAAAALGVSYHAVRRHMDAVGAICGE